MRGQAENTPPPSSKPPTALLAFFRPRIMPYVISPLVKARCMRSKQYQSRSTCGLGFRFSAQGSGLELQPSFRDWASVTKSHIRPRLAQIFFISRLASFV